MGNEAKERADALVTLLGARGEALADLEESVAGAYARTVEMERSDDSLVSCLRGAIAGMGDDPLEKVLGIAKSVSLGNAGWSAERDGMRFDEWCIDRLRNADLPYYVRRLAREGMESGAANAYLDLCDKALAILEAG